MGMPTHKDLFKLMTDGLDKISLKEIEDLTIRLEKADRKLKEERFVWIVAFIILFDSNWLLNASSWAGPIVIGTFEIILILIIAEKFQIKAFIGIIDRIFETKVISLWIKEDF